MNDFLEFLLDTLLPGVAIAVVVIGGFVGILVGIDYFGCRGFQNATGLQTRWDWGCYAQMPDGRWVPNKYVFGDANEIRVR